MSCGLSIKEAKFNSRVCHYMYANTNICYIVLYGKTRTAYKFTG